MRWENKENPMKKMKWNELNFYFILFFFLKNKFEIESSSSLPANGQQKKKSFFEMLRLIHYFNFQEKKRKKFHFWFRSFGLVVVAHLDAWWWWWWFPIRIRPRMKKNEFQNIKIFWNNLTKNEKTRKQTGRSFV